MIDQLKIRLGTALTTGAHCRWLEVVGDISLLRFLRGGRHNVEQAAVLFHEHLEIRERFGLDEIRATIELQNEKVQRERIEKGLPRNNDYLKKWKQLDIKVSGILCRRRQHFCAI